MAEKTKHYDLIVIGAGSGLDVAVAAAQNYDWKVAMIEKGPMGGTCLNRGCIPSKIIIHPADLAETIKNASKFGIQAEIKKIDFSSIINRSNSHVDEESEMIERNLKESKILDLYKTKGEFVDSKTIAVGKEKITGDKILIAAGARPFIPPIEGLDKINYLTSTEALRLEKQPKSMVIIGGGYIASELGHFYGALGTKITVIQKGERLVDREDIDISKKFTEVFSKKYEVFLNSEVKSVKEKKDGTKIVTFEGAGGKEGTVEAEEVLIAVGIQPNTDTLGLENTKVETNERGYIKVSDFMETAQKDVFALGDIVGKAPFKHGANWEAQHVFSNLRGERKYPVSYLAMPHAIFSSPRVAGVGLTEQQAKEKNLSYEVRTHEYKDTGMGIALGEEDGFVKFIIDPKKDKILGCHILGPNASILIEEVVVVMKVAGGDIAAIKNSIHIHPALSEVVQRAL